MHHIGKAWLRGSRRRWRPVAATALVGVLCAAHPAGSFGASEPARAQCDGVGNASDRDGIVPPLLVSQIVGLLHDRGKEMHWARRRSLVRRGAPGLEHWLRRANKALLAAGASPIPGAAAARLAAFFPRGLVRRARYVVSRDLFESLSAAPFRFDDVDAVTVVNVIVFRDAAAAGRELSWARELARVAQFERWGVDAFARKYLESWRRLARESRRVAAEYTDSAPRSPWPGLGVPDEAPGGDLVAQSSDRTRAGGCRDSAALD